MNKAYLNKVNKLSKNVFVCVCVCFYLYFWKRGLFALKWHKEQPKKSKIQH